jgi:AraC family transcriptional regulator, transcriptional activator FtrA
MTPTIGFLVYPDFQILDLGGPLATFQIAGRLSPDAPYALPVLSLRGGLVASSSGLAVMTEAIDDRDFDTLVVVGGIGARTDATPALAAMVRACTPRTRRVASVCTGAFILAEAGLLDGRRATTHWAHTERLVESYGNVDVYPDVLYVEDGGILTSAGAAAGIDLCLHMVRADFGSDVANAVARRLVVPPHRDGGQAQFIDAPMPRGDSDGLGPLLDWAVARLDEPLTLDDMARQAHISTRTLVRRFQAATGTTPLQWLLAQRVRRAQHLLEASDEPVERVASMAGFGTAANLRQHFTRAVGVAPMAYRRTFKGEGTAVVA